MSEVTQTTYTIPTIVFLTPDPDDEEWQPFFARHAPSFAALGAIVLSMPWSAAPILTEPSYIYLVNFAWNYHLSAERWTKWLQSWPKQIRLINSPSLLLWNTKKTYLAYLEKAGVPTIPTSYVDRVDRSTLIQAAAHFDTCDLIVKPQISAGSYNTVRVLVGNNDYASRPQSISIEEALEQLNKKPTIGAWMIQPFMTSVCDEGEISVTVFGGQISHAVKKTARTNDYRVQGKYGGKHAAYDDISPEIQKLVNATLSACPEMPLYARIDMLRNDTTYGSLCVIELELIEPDLFTQYKPDGDLVFAKTILDTMR